MRAARTEPGRGPYCSPEGVRLYRDLFESSRLELMGVDVYVYIRTSPEVAFDRIARRAAAGRVSETGVTLEYVRTLHQLYEDYIMRLTRGGYKVFVIENDETLAADQQAAKNRGVVERIRNFTLSM